MCIALSFASRLHRVASPVALVSARLHQRKRLAKAKVQKTLHQSS